MNNNKIKINKNKIKINKKTYCIILELMLFVLQSSLKYTEYKLEKKIPGLH